VALHASLPTASLSSIHTPCDSVRCTIPKDMRMPMCNM
jgi:hypothetical protein